MAKRNKSSFAKRSIGNRGWLVAILSALLIAGAVLGILHYRHQPSATRTTTTPKVNNTSATAAPPSKDATRQPSTVNNTVNQGGAVDQNGKAPGTSSSSSQWTTSSSGLLTLKDPIKNSVFKSGDSIYGSASSGPVQFRLIDNQVGVIAQGTINVVGGAFSGVASFKSYSTSGRLDVFNTDTGGKEINEVQVPVSF